MVLNGLINTRLLALAHEFGIAAIGISGVDGGLVKAHKRAPVTLASARWWTTAWWATSTAWMRRSSPACSTPVSCRW